MSDLLDNALVGTAAGPPAPAADIAPELLVLGVGNVLMGDEGVGIHVLRALENDPPGAGVRLLDGGTGGINLLLELDGYTDIILVDATLDGQPAGTVTRLKPRHVGELPRGLGAHDFGLKDLFAVAALLNRSPSLHLFTVSVETVRPMCLELSPAVAGAVPRVVDCVRDLVRELTPP